MGIKKLEFIEQYIDEVPTENYWRGMIAKLDGRSLFQIDYFPEDDDYKEHFIINSSTFPSEVFDETRNDKVRDITDKEEIKVLVQSIFEKIVNKFLTNN